MNDIIIDTNVIVGLYKEEVLGLTYDRVGLSGSAIDLMGKISKQKDILYLDGTGESNGQIVNEWKRNIPRDGGEWFTNWYGNLLLSHRVKFISADSRRSQVLLRKMYSCGFPRRSRDKWFVRTAFSVCICKNGKTKRYLVTIISEDLDFFDPVKKDRTTGHDRIRLLQTADGKIPALLAEAKIRVTCVSNY